MNFKLLFLIFLINVNFAFAKTLARVGEFKGNSFVFWGNKKSAVLKYGDKIPDLSEIMVEDNSYLTLMNYEGHTYHLAGGSHVKFYNNMMEVKNGKVWINSENSTDQFIVQSVNASASYQKGQFIFSFSNVDGKSQVLVLDGEVLFNNVLEPQLVENVSAGFFSLIDKDINNGIPRSATRIGLHSYTNMKLSFEGIEQIENSNFENMLKEFKFESSTQTRSIASIENTNTKKGMLYFYDSQKKKLITEKNKRVPSSQEFSAVNYFEQIKSKQRSDKNKMQTKEAKVRVFGGLDLKNNQAPKSSELDFTVKIESARTPASIETSDIVKDLNTSFEKSLNDKIQIDKRHPEEVNQLINDLKSYDNNFKKNY